MKVEEESDMDQDREQMIRERAYFLWKKEGAQEREGQDLVDWERATLLHDAEHEQPMVTPLQARSPAEVKVDEMVEESFPASDPPTLTPGAGTLNE